MCYNCGCFIPDDDMGFPDNITEKTLQDLANKWSKTLPETKKDLYRLLLDDNPKLGQEPLKSIFEKAAAAWSQSMEEAKKNTASLLKSQII